MKYVLVGVFVTFLTGCSLFGDNNVPSAPYKVVLADSEQAIEIRQYEPMILVSAEMKDGQANDAFRKLFKYISGHNQGSQKISMTAPVLLDDKPKGTEISMTAPVLMNQNSDQSVMSFVMPKHFTLETTPLPTDNSLTISKVSNYHVATIEFSGTLSDSNVKEHTQQLQTWLANSQYRPISKPIQAAYNGPLTLPPFRHNEILIEIEKE